MPLNITNFIFTTDVLSNLDTKYTNGISLDYSKLFIYANLIDLPYLYTTGNSFKTNSFDLYNKIHFTRRGDLLKNIITYIKTNDYNKNNILLLYAIICNLTLNDITKEYFNTLNKEILTRDIDYLFGKRNNYDLSKTKLTKLFQKAFVLDFHDYDLIGHMLNKTYYFPKGETYFTILIKKYKKILRSSKIKKIHYKLKDFFTKKKNMKYSYYIYNKKTCINDTYLEEEINDQSFSSLYAKALKEALYVINITNNYLFYNNPKEFNNYFQE